MMKTKKLLFGMLASLLIVGFAMSAYGAGEVFKWRAQTYAVSGSVGFKAAEQALASLKEASGGRIEIKLYGSGTLVGAFEQLDAMGKGIFEAGFNAPAFYAGKDAAFPAIFSLIGLWDDTSQAKIWMHYFGGHQLAEELYSKYNVQYVGSAMIGAEPIMSKVPIRSLEDFKGIKIRTPGGLTSMLFSKLGASPVPLPGGELYTALDTGVVDAAEFVTLAENWDIGLHEVTKFVLYPSFHGPIAICDFTVNKKAWDSLPADLKALMLSWAYELDSRYDYMSAAESLTALKKMKDKGLTHTKLSEADMQKARDLSLEVALEWKQKSPMAGRVIDSILDYLKLAGALK